MKKNKPKINMNRRGDIPITFLVIGIILVCCIAVFSFISSTIKTRDSLIGVNLVEKLNSQAEEKISNNENPTGLYVEKKVTRGFLFWSREVLLFSAEYKSQP